MNLIANVGRRPIGRSLLRILFLVVSLLAAPAWSAQTAEGKRILFIIDTSSGMKPMEMPMRETLFDLIYSGARGNMTNGDTFGVWLVGEKNDTSFPMETWKEKFAVEMGAKAVSHMKDQGFKGRANLALALADVNRILKSVGDLTVILVSNGETPLAGTPFDELINPLFRELAPVMKTAKATVNTALVAQDGKFVAWALNSPQFLLDVPYVAPNPRLVKVEPPVVASVPVAKPAKVVVPPPRLAANSIIITKDSVAEERRTYVSSATTASAPPAARVATATTNVPSTPSPGTASNVVTAVTTNLTNSVAVMSAAPAPLVTSLAPATTAVAVVTMETKSTNIAAAPAKISSVPPEATARDLSFIFLCAGAGAGGAFVIVLGVLFFTRASRREPSLISQAIARERMEARVTPAFQPASREVFQPSVPTGPA